MKLMEILNINDVIPFIEGKKVIFVTGVTGQDAVTWLITYCQIPIILL